MKYLAPIDPHVHLRGSEYSFDYKSLGLAQADAVGLAAVMEMPNCQPFLIDSSSLFLRRGDMSKHFMHIGITNNPDQVLKALKLVKDRAYCCRADKIFYTHSTGDMGILDDSVQRGIWKMKGEMGYTGVSIGHFEDEKLYGMPFDPKIPVTHSERQGPDAELKQVQRQLIYAREYNFQGTFYIAHVSNPETVDFVHSERKWAPFRIVLEATFHHLFMNFQDYEVHGNIVKMNPPLRPLQMQERLLNRYLDGKIDIIGTDHAPHPLARKTDPVNPASGIPAIPFWPKGIERLKRLGASKLLIDNTTFHAANTVFQLGLKPVEVDREYQPRMWDEYGYNPFSRVDR